MCARINEELWGRRILAIICLVGNVVGFNFDTNFPIVYVDPFNYTGSRLEKSSYFGYSVILYNGTTNNDAWIQIGAPRGQNPVLENETTGVVFRCGIKSTCRNVNMRPSTDPDTYAGEAYFGNSMDISANNEIFAVCGHRWISKTSTDYYMQGACFGGKTNENDTQFFNSLHKQPGQTQTVGGVRVYNKAQAQMGFSAQFIRSPNKNDLLIGLPGLLNWKGAPGLLSNPGRPEPARRRRIRSIDDLSETTIPEAVGIDEIKYFDLAGYSVTSGRFYGDRSLYYVTGAPRATLKGSVLVFQFVTDRGSKFSVKDRRDGHHIGEYFGSSIAASDINGDGLDDLIVGAPFHKSSSSSVKFDGGAIYVYLGSKGKLIDAPTNLIEGKVNGGRLGESMISLGDIDKDGCEDIAVAAPYENEDSGVVYIFRGDRLSGLIKEPSQIIEGRKILPNIKGFGISFSKPTDVDGNRYSDLAIGAYKSGHAVLLRAKPVVTLDHNLTSSLSQISVQNITPTFDIKSCVSFSGVSITPPIRVVRTLSVDRSVADRAYLKDASNIKLDSELTSPDVPVCESYVVQVRSSNNIYDPIRILASVDLVKRPESSSLITVTDKVEGKDEFCATCAVLRTTDDTAKQISVDYNRECGEDNICDSRLALSAKFADFNAPSYVVGSMEYITLSATVGNSRENAFQTEVLISLPNPIRLKRIPPNCKESASEISCRIDNPLTHQSERTVSLELDLDEVNTGKFEKDLNFLLKVKTSSNNDGDTEKTLTLKLTKKAAVELRGTSSEETYSYVNRTYGSANFQQIFKILKYDISPIQKAKLTVSIPTTISFGGKNVKFLSLYAPEGTLAGQAITCETTIETLMDSQAPTAVGDSDKKKRKRRDVVDVDDQLAKYPANRTIYFNCSTEGVQCGIVSCDFGPFRNVKHIAELRLKMILNISELTDYMPEKDIVIVSTSAGVDVADKVENDGLYKSVLLVPSVFIGASAEQSIATWIIIVAIICGILLLALLAGILYKVGFFRRAKKDLLLEEKAKHNAEDPTELLHNGDGAL